jgi:acyl carrier protein
MASLPSWNQFAVVVGDHLGLTPSQITTEMNIYQDLGLDSLGVVSLGVRLHLDFGVNVPLEAVATIKTLGDMHRLLREHASAEVP